MRRVEVIAGAGRRRHFSASEKSRIVEEALAPDAVVSEIARRHGLTPRQLFTWRRAARRRLSMDRGKTEAPFAPAIVNAARAHVRVAIEGAGGEAVPCVAGPHEIELDVVGDSVWIWSAADLHALRHRPGTSQPSLRRFVPALFVWHHTKCQFQPSYTSSRGLRDPAVQPNRAHSRREPRHEENSDDRRRCRLA